MHVHFSQDPASGRQRQRGPGRHPSTALTSGHHVDAARRRRPIGCTA